MQNNSKSLTGFCAECSMWISRVEGERANIMQLHSGKQKASRDIFLSSCAKSANLV